MIDPDAGALPPEDEYLAAVESKLAELRGAPLVLSSRDWERVHRWRERAIPLRVVLRALTDVLGRKPSRPPGQVGSPAGDRRAASLRPPGQVGSSAGDRRAASPPPPGQVGSSAGDRRAPFGEGEEFPRRAYSLAYCERAVEQRWRSEREGWVGRRPASPPSPARLRSVLRSLASQVRSAAARARRGGRPALAAPLRDLAGALREAARQVPPSGDPLGPTCARLLEAEGALRSGLRAALGEQWPPLCDKERARLGASLVRMSAAAARATAEAAALGRLRQELGVPTFDPGSLHARLQRRSPRPRA